MAGLQLKLFDCMATIRQSLDASVQAARRSGHSLKGIAMNRISGCFATALLLVASAASSSAADLVDKAASATNLKIFSAAIKSAGFNETLKGTGPYTVFAPSDEAFSKLPTGSWEALSKDRIKLAAVLAHHVVPGRMLVTEVKPGQIKTTQGDFVTVKSDNGKVTVDQANVIESDVAADNGVIHILDKVVLPE
jgi:uncharacterized surface protein with fasciclin (FAS1) repeats